MRTAYRIVKFAFQNFWRNFWFSVITVSMLILTLLTVNLLLLLNVITEKAISLVEERIEVSVYFKAETAPERVANAAGYLRGLPQVREVVTISADEALARFRERHAGEDTILRSLDEIGRNPFGSTLVVKAQSSDQFPFILEALDHPQFRDDIREKDFSDYQKVIDRIRLTTDRIRGFGIALSVVFLVIAMLIVFNTVRMGIFTHKEEIGIMKLVGATNAFVRTPFLVEALLYSLFASVLVAALMFPLVAFLETRFTDYFEGNSVGLTPYFEHNGLLLFGVQFAILAVISIISTAFAMRKYLRV